MTFAAGTVDKPGNTGLLVKKFFDFLAGNNNQRGKSLRLPDAQTVATTTASETGTAIDLTAEGFVFLADYLYKITFRSIATTDNDRWIQEWEQYVLGGTTPVLVGTARLAQARGIINGTVVRYGVVQYHGTTAGATVTNGADVDSGLSLGNFSSGVATLTHPIARATQRVIATHLSEDAGTIGDTRVIQARVASSTTITVNAATQNGTEALTDPLGVNNVDLEIYILPPPGVALAMATNNVTVTVSHDASDEVRHLVQVWIEEDPLYAPFYGS